MHSATQILASKEWKVGFIKMFNHKPLLVSDDRSLLSCCTVLCTILHTMCEALFNRITEAILNGMKIRLKKGHCILFFLS